VTSYIDRWMNGRISSSSRVATVAYAYRGGHHSRTVILFWQAAAANLAKLAAVAA